MAIDNNIVPLPASPSEKRRWSSFIPRPGSSSDRNSRSFSFGRNGLPSSNGWLGSGGPLASFKRSTNGGSKGNEVVVPTLSTPIEGKEMNTSDSPISENGSAAVSSFFNRPRPASSSGRPTTSSSVTHNGRPSSSSGWFGSHGAGAPYFTLGGPKRSTSTGSNVNEVVVPILSPPIEGKEMNASDPSTSENGSATVSTFFNRPKPASSSGKPTTSSSVTHNGRSSSSSGWFGSRGGGAPHFTLGARKRSASTGSQINEVIVPILSPPTEGKEMNASDSSTSKNEPAAASTFVNRPGAASSSGRPAPSSSVTRNGRPSSSSGWFGSREGGVPHFTFGSLKRSTSTGSKVKEVVVPITAPSIEGKEMNVSDSSTREDGPQAVSTFVTVPTTSVPMMRSLTYDSPSSSRPTTPKSSSLLTSSLKSPQALDYQASQLVANAAERTCSLKSPDHSRNGSSFGKSFTSMMGGLSSLSLSRTGTRESFVDDKERGRTVGKIKRPKSASQAPGTSDRDFNNSTSRARSQSPFSLRRFRTREASPTPQALPLGQSDAEMSDTASLLFPRSTAFTDDDSGDETIGTEAETEYGSSSDEDTFDLITERNTERNALIPHVALDPTVPAEIEDPDPVGEGVNVIIAPEPYFPSSLNTLGSINRGKRNPRRRKSVKTHEPLPFQTSRPVFKRDRCTITIIQGDPEGKLGTRRMRRYVVASDLSQESRYAVEWGIGTVLRDGDEMLIVTVVEGESKVDPPIPNAADRATKLRSQQERQALAYILIRQVTGLLQRTKLNVKVSCQAWHAKNSRHMLLDIIDYVEPTMLIVGSRGLGQLNGILLGSTSHYLIQKCSVPVMVARRRLKRPPKRSAHLSTRRVHVSLAEAGIDRVATKVDQDVQVMRDEIQKDDKRRVERRGSRDDGRFVGASEGDLGEEDDHDPEDENDEDPIGVKVAGDVID